MAAYHHLSAVERTHIQYRLNCGDTPSSIAAELGRSTSTITREIRKHRQYKEKGTFGRSFNPCRHRRTCKRMLLCEDPRCSHKYCSQCSRCTKICTHFEEERCQRLDRPPYVCNGCQCRKSCALCKYLYEAKRAQTLYEESLSQSRAGVHLSEEERLRLDALISPLLLKGQSIHSICARYRDVIMLDEKTIYNYVNLGLFQARNLDLARKVRRRPVHKPASTLKVDKTCRQGRTLEDYDAFLQKHPDLPVVQMDSVVGCVGSSKVLLSIHFVQQQFMLLFLRPHNTSQSVIDIFEQLQDCLGIETFRRLFPVILTDNGSEFSNPKRLEFDTEGHRRTRLFYCDPYSSWQKGSIENNHEFIRKVLPKGSSFDQMTQADCLLLMNHINSYPRKKLNDRSPHQSFSFFFGSDILMKLGAQLIPADEITLTPNLLK